WKSYLRLISKSCSRGRCQPFPWHHFLFADPGLLFATTLCWNLYRGTRAVPAHTPTWSKSCSGQLFSESAAQDGTYGISSRNIQWRVPTAPAHVADDGWALMIRGAAGNQATSRPDSASWITSSDPRTIPRQPLNAAATAFVSP